MEFNGIISSFRSMKDKTIRITIDSQEAGPELAAMAQLLQDQFITITIEEHD